MFLLRLIEEKILCPPPHTKKASVRPSSGSWLANFRGILYVSAIGGFWPSNSPNFASMVYWHFFSPAKAPHKVLLQYGYEKKKEMQIKNGRIM